MINIKSEYEISVMREAGRIVALTHKRLKEMIAPGISLLELDREAERIIKKHGCKPSFKGYGGFPSSICTSVNDVLIHGIPSKYKLKNGDIISIDVGVEFKGYHGDAAFTMGVGKIRPEHQRLMDICKEALEIGKNHAMPGAYTGDIGNAIQTYVEKNGFQVVRDFAGHGIGKDLHEDPIIPNYGSAGTGIKLLPGMTICIEPMILMESKDYKIDNDQWTVRSKDKQYTAHDEYQLVINNNGNEILTKI